MRKVDRIEFLKGFIKKNIVVLAQDLHCKFNCSWDSIKRDLRNIKCLSSFTHGGQYITLPDTPSYNNRGIWFHRKIGFTKHNNSIDLVVNIIESADEYLSREEIEEITKIKVGQQIQKLLMDNRLNRLKLGRKYYYFSNKLNKNKIQPLMRKNIEEYHDIKIKTSEVIQLLKLVLKEYEVTPDTIKKITKKHSINISTKKVERIFAKYGLYEKKTH